MRRPCYLALALFGLRLAAPAAMAQEELIAPADQDGPGRIVLRAGPFTSAWSLALTADGKTLVTGHEGFVRAWDLPTRRELFRVPTGKTVRRVDVTPDGRTIATAEYRFVNGKATENTVVIRDGRTGAALHVMKGMTSGVNCVAISPDGEMVVSTCWGETDIRVWDAKKGEEAGTLAGHSGSVATAVFSPDGKTLASAGDRTVRLWDSDTGEVRKVLQGHKYPVESVAFSADGKTLATGGFDNTARVWDGTSGKQLAGFGMSQPVLTVAFSPDGKTLATTSARWGSGFYGAAPTEVRLWDVATKKPVATLPKQPNQVFAMVFTPDGKTLITSSLSGAVTLWDLDKFIRGE